MPRFPHAPTRILFLLPLLALVVGCDGDMRSSEGPPETPRGDTVDLATQEALELAIRYPCDDSLQMPDGLPAAFTDRFQEQNEVHDCQKLVVGDEFGPLVAIYPIRQAMEADAEAFTDSAGVVVATVFSWDSDGGYDTLGIRAHWQCLWLRNWRGGWEAEMREQASGETCAQGSGDAVRPLVVRSRGYGQIPPTARWGWDRENELHYMGIKCGSRWCSVGVDGLIPEQPVDGPLGTGTQAAAPGWYDSQHLAVPNGSGAMRPGPWATIYPTPNLRSRTSVDQYREWVDVAYISLDASDGSPALDHYRRGLGLGRAPATEPMGDGNRLELKVEISDDEADTVWTARVHSTDAPPVTTEFAVDWARLHHAASGATRWRWLDDDESGWIPCPEGCCTPEMNGNGASD